MNVSYKKAVELFEKKDYKSAENILHKLADKKETKLDALYFLGIIHLNLSNYETAKKYFQLVVNSNNKIASVHYHLGYCFQMLTELDSAIYHYNKCIGLDNKFVDCYNNLGVIYFNKKEFQQAEYYYNQALKYDALNSKVLNNFGNLYLEKNDYDEAIKFYNLAINSDSTVDKNYFNLANCYHRLNQYEQAIEFYNKAIELNPIYIEALKNLGSIYVQKKYSTKSEEIFNKLLSNSKNKIEDLNFIGLCFKNYDKKKSLEYFKKVLELSSDNKTALFNIGDLLKDLGEEDDSDIYINKALKDESAKVVLYNYLGLSKLRNHKLDDAIKYFNEALKSNENSSETHYNKSHALLLNKDFENGWKEYEWRLKRDDFKKFKLSKPILDNQDVTGKKILVLCEQGFGDAFQFVRYLPMLKNLSCEILLLCSKRLVKVFKNLTCIDEIIPRENYDEPNIDYDYYAYLLSLPKYFKTNLQNIPAQIPYLNADKNLYEKWGKIVKQTNKFKVGIVWGGSPTHTNDKNRSCLLTDFITLSSLEEIEMFILQKGQPLKQLENVRFPFVDMNRFGMDDFADTSAIIHNLDLVITVDTSVAHLAGAMGKEVWILIPYFPDWRWLLEGDSSFWYPDVKLFRQKKAGNWSDVFESVTMELKKKITPQNNFTFYSQIDKDNLYLGLAKENNFGWGICSRYLKKELSKTFNIINLEENKELINKQRVEGKIFHALTNQEFESIYNVTGTINYGYTFFESELNEKSIENSKKYDIIFTGSTWNKEKILEKGITNSKVLIQGIDPEIFYPVEDNVQKNLFTIFSGGKFELRKGQDLVLRAIKILQEKYDNIILLNSWYNFWPATMTTMNLTKHIKLEMNGNTWEEIMNSLYKANGINEKKIITLPIVDNNKMREVYAKTDLGLFPNRCEGGTNLVLMEYMACGKPVVASFNSGHKDILTSENSFPLKEMQEFKVVNNNKQLLYDWTEPSIDEIIYKIEFAYNNIDEAKKKGNRAGEDLKKLTWQNTAESLIKEINSN